MFQRKGQVNLNERYCLLEELSSQGGKLVLGWEVKFEDEVAIDKIFSVGNDLLPMACVETLQGRVLFIACHPGLMLRFRGVLFTVAVTVLVLVAVVLVLVLVAVGMDIVVGLLILPAVVEVLC